MAMSSCDAAGHVAEAVEDAPVLQVEEHGDTADDQKHGREMMSRHLGAGARAARRGICAPNTPAAQASSVVNRIRGHCNLHNQFLTNHRYAQGSQRGSDRRLNCPALRQVGGQRRARNKGKARCLSEPQLERSDGALAAGTSLPSPCHLRLRRM